MKNQKLIIILLVAILAVLLIPYLALGAVLGVSTSQMNRYPVPTSTAVQRKHATAKDVAAMISGNCQMMFGDNFSDDLDEDSGYYSIRIWDASLDAGLIERAVAGENRDSWESMVYSYTQTANTMQRAFTDNGIDDVTVVLTVCDPEDHDVPYFMIANGIVGYDAVKGIDLRAGEDQR